MIELSAFLAFGAGLLSFLSPCVFPLIPSYLFFVGGMGLEKTGSSAAAAGNPESRDGKGGKGLVLGKTAFFVLGFSAVFVITSIALSGLVAASGAKYIDIAAGIVVIVLGLNVLFDFLKFLNYEKRLRINRRPGSGPGGFAGAFLAGAAFGAGWTPCVGPVLGSILLLAGQSGRPGLAAFYLALYSAGLGLPFLAAALFFDRFLAGAQKIKKHLPLIQKISGILLICTGLLILSGRFQAINILIQKWQYSFIVWAENRGPVARLIASWLSFLQGI
ncbi:MAG: cytochrome c biogenesis protein CcdA [Treponema sp.]|jgi:cytochrome c-type biogenesis protein|nr:cytochrome c biogenesis protein CcdA [Treponema sp.]